MYDAELSISTADRLCVEDVTEAVRRQVPEDATGTVTVFVEHTTCAIAINEAEDRLLGDFESYLADAVPDSGWAHDEIDDNADAHLRAMLVGPGETVPVADGRLQLGTWQSVLLVECDGPRSRTVRVTVTE